MVNITKQYFKVMTQYLSNKYKLSELPCQNSNIETTKTSEKLILVRSRFDKVDEWNLIYFKYSVYLNLLKYLISSQSKLSEIKQKIPEIKYELNLIESKVYHLKQTPIRQEFNEIYSKFGRKPIDFNLTPKTLTIQLDFDFEMFSELIQIKWPDFDELQIDAYHDNWEVGPSKDAIMDNFK